MKKQIVSCTPLQKGFFVEEKKETKEYLVLPVLEKLSFEKKTDRKYVVTFNNEQNVSYVIQHWKELVADASLTFLFVNTKTNEKWHLHPSQHQKISEDITKSLHILLESIDQQES
jgi:hypothetical protein